MPRLERKWWTLITVCTAIFMLLLDISVVNVALPSIQRDLHSSFSDLQWVVDAYALTLSAALLTAGVIGDIFGRRNIFAVGLGVFTVSSFVCGVSQSSIMLNIARGAQGTGGAVMFATSLALIADAFQGRERGTAFGIYGSVIGGAVAVGPLVGGAITSSIGWRWIFFLNVPIGVIAILLTLSKVAESKDPHTRRIDWFGFVTFSAALFLVVLALIRGNTDGWTSGLILGMFASAAFLFVVFVVGELRQRDPMLDLSLFRRPAMVGVSASAFAIAASIFALFLYLTLYIQDDLGYGALQTGLRFLAISLPSFAAAPFAGRLSVRVPARYLLGIGLLFVAGGLLLMSRTTATSGWTLLLPGFILGGIGVGTANPVIASSAVGVVPPERSGMASGINNTFRQVGVATGIAALGAVFVSQVRTKVTASLLATSAGRAAIGQHHATLATALASGQVRTVLPHLPADQAHAVLAAYQSGFSSAFDHLMWIGAGLAFVGSVVAFAFTRQRDFVVSRPGGPPGDGGRPGPAPGLAADGSPGGAHPPAGDGPQERPRVPGGLPTPAA